MRVVSAFAEPDGCSDSAGWCYFLMTARTADTKGGADVKKGDKVTVKYTMTATSIEAKGAEKAAKKAAGAK